MSETMTCAQVQDLSGELALGLVVGPERAAALAHLERCADCRTAVADLTRVVDHLLVGGPEQEPPGGFESRVLGAIAPPDELAAARSRAGMRRGGSARRRVMVLVAAAAAVVALAVGAVALSVRSTGSHPPVLRSAAMITPAGTRVGKFEIGGTPRTVFVAMPGWYEYGDDGTAYRLRVALADGTARQLGPVVLSEGGTWGAVTDLDPKAVRAVTLVDAAGRELCHARLTGA